MTALDIKKAKQALAWRLREWDTSDPDSRAASFIDDLVSQGWQMSPDRESRPRPPKPHEACRTCGRRLDGCDCDGGPTVHPVAQLPDASSRVAHLRALIDHRATTDTDQPKEQP